MRALLTQPFHTHPRVVLILSTLKKKKTFFSMNPSILSTNKLLSTYDKPEKISTAKSKV